MLNTSIFCNSLVWSLERTAWLLLVYQVSARDRFVGQLIEKRQRWKRASSTPAQVVRAVYNHRLHDRHNIRTEMITDTDLMVFELIKTLIFVI